MSLQFIEGTKLVDSLVVRLQNPPFFPSVTDNNNLYRAQTQYFPLLTHSLQKARHWTVVLTNDEEVVVQTVQPNILQTSINY